MNETVLAIDIGSTKICAVIAEIVDSKVNLLGHGTSKSQGIKKGVINNIELSSKSIRKAINDAKRIAGSSLSSATVSISNAYVKSLTSTGVVNISQKDISITEIKRVIQTAVYNADIPNDSEIIHVLPYNFRVDNQDFIEDPYGMNASRMEVDINIITTLKSNLSNLKKAVHSAGIEIESIVLSGYASAIAVMNEDEKEFGAAVIDLGGQTSNLIVHAGNSIRYSDFLGVGSNHITNDLSIALHTPLQIAEDVKIHYGNLTHPSSEIIELPIIGDEKNNNKVSLEVVHTVIFARVEETLMLLAKSLEKSTLKDNIGSVVLTGGTIKLKGIRELAQSIFPTLPVRLATVGKGINGLFDELKDPSYSAVLGLLLYKAGKSTQYEIDFQEKLLHTKDEERGHLENIKIANTVNETKKSKASNENRPANDNSFSFEDLPDIAEENNNLGKKALNWAKQLF